MQGETVVLEVIKAGLSFLGGTFVQLISNANKNRLEEKKRKVQKEKGSRSSNDIQLKESERLDGHVNLNLETAYINIQNHLKEIEKWADDIKFKDLARKKTLGSIYVELDTYLVPANRHVDKVEKENRTRLEKTVLSGKEHCVILGQPGAGKTTSMKKICDLVLREERNTSYTFPILLRLRNLGDIDSSTPILDFISGVIPFEFEFKDKSDSKFAVGTNDVRVDAMISFLNYIKPVLILDGFDELKDSKSKEIVLKELQILASKLSNSKIILSCRTGEFNNELDFSNTFEIAPLNDTQIKLFVNKWLEDSDKATDFLEKVKRSPFADTSIKPLSLAHLCAIYLRVGDIPDQPKTVYRKVVNLLVEEWDEQRSIKRKSAFDGFQTDQKFEFLAHLAFFLTTTYKTSIFSVSQFKNAYQNICEYHNLPKEKATEIVRELESHTGLFIESGYEEFEFVHKSIQEYLTAEYLVKLISLNTVKSHIDNLGSELAIAVSISSDSSLYYVELVLNYFTTMTLSSAFYSSFCSRIVSENPKFNQNELVSTTTLVLLSSWINPGNKRFNLNTNSSISTESYRAFFELSNSLKLKEQKVNILKYYEYYSDVHNNTVVELSRIREPENHRRLPKRIYLPMEFYQEFTS